MIAGLSVTRGAVRVAVRDEELLRLLRSHASHADGCPLCLDEIFGTRGCAYFQGILEHRLMELSKEEHATRFRASVRRMAAERKEVDRG